MVLFEDTAAILGILIALAGTLAAEQLNEPLFDGAASIAIGVLLGTTAAYLARESKGLLIGEPARSDIRDSITQIAAAQPGIEKVNDLLTVHLAPRQIVAALSLDFDDNRRAVEIETDVAAIETAIRERHPEVTAIFIKPQKLGPRSGNPVRASR